MLDVCKQLKKNYKSSMWDLGDICIYPFWIAWTGPDKSEKKNLGYTINILSI